MFGSLELLSDSFVLLGRECGTVDNKGQNAAAWGGGVLSMRAFLVPGVMTAN